MRFTAAVVFWGLADYSVNEVIDFYASREEADRATNCLARSGRDCATTGLYGAMCTPGSARLSLTGSCPLPWAAKA